MKIAIVVGTRPEVIKLAPLIKKLDQEDCLLIGIGQHDELLFQALKEFGLECDEFVSINRITGSMNEMIAQVPVELEGILEAYNQFDTVVVQGDTMTTFVAAMTSYLCKKKIVHVEAGLRTYNLDHPYPEEAFRQMVSRIATLNCVPTKDAMNSLLIEKVSGKIVVTGNTIVDSVQMMRSDGVEKEKNVLLTIHRRESNAGDLERIFAAVKMFAKKHDDWSVVFPVHPRLEEAVFNEFRDMTNVLIDSPVKYSELLWLIQRSSFVVTDSGGIQEEAGVLGTPTVVCRETTERVESIDVGASVLCGRDTEKIFNEMDRLASDEEYRKNRSVIVTAYGDGKAAERIIEAIRGL